MGGSISFVKRLDRKVTCVEAHTNSLTSQVNNIKFFEDHNFLDTYQENLSRYENLRPVGYGIFIVDYDTKSIYTINRYSSYIDILPVSYDIYSNGMYGGSAKNPYEKWFKSDLLLVKKTFMYDNGSFDEVILDNKFDTLKDMCDYVGDNQYTKIENGSSHTMIFLDLEKIGWKSYNYSESFNGYFKLYNQLLKDGFNLSMGDLDMWNNYIFDHYINYDDYDDYDDYDLYNHENDISRSDVSFKSEIIQSIREKELNELIENK